MENKRPRGRPKGSLNKATADIKALAMEHAPKAMKELDAPTLALTLLEVIEERHQNGRGGGYYTYRVRDDPRETEPNLRDVGLDGEDDLIAICEEALTRLRTTTR